MKIETFGHVILQLLCCMDDNKIQTILLFYYNHLIHVVKTRAQVRLTRYQRHDHIYNIALMNIK
jgi:hypothetical protein